MAIWNVSRVAPSHAFLQATTDHRLTLRVDELAPHIAAEPELALGLRLFWASIVVMTLVVAIPIFVGWMLKPATDLGPEAVIRPAILGDHVASPKVVAPHDLPKAQSPPLELLQYSPGHVVSKGN
jgi:hypothetical protein